MPPNKELNDCRACIRAFLQLPRGREYSKGQMEADVMRASRRLHKYCNAEEIVVVKQEAPAWLTMDLIAKWMEKQLAVPAFPEGREPCKSAPPAQEIVAFADDSATPCRRPLDYYRRVHRDRLKALAIAECGPDDATNKSGQSAGESY